MRRLLLATHNHHKVMEFQRIFTDLPFHILTLADFPAIDDVEETGTTFRENAELKARSYALASGLLSLADDSGLEIDALNGAPGIYSARFAGRDTPYQERFQLLLEQLRGLPAAQRTARFRCTIAVAEPSGLCRSVEGVAEGIIAEDPRGTQGFGYDPIFYVPELGRTYAELPSDTKDHISHRGRASQLARTLLADWPAPSPEHS